MIHQLCRSILGPPASSRSRREAGKDAGGPGPCALRHSTLSETASVHGLLALAVLAPGAPETEDLRQSPPGSVVVQVGRGHLVAPLVLSARPPVVRLHLPLGAQGQGGQAGARVAEQVDVVVERRLVICDEQQIGAPGVQHLLAEVALAARACPSSVLNTRCESIGRACAPWGSPGCAAARETGAHFTPRGPAPSGGSPGSRPQPTSGAPTGRRWRWRGGAGRRRAQRPQPGCGPEGQRDTGLWCVWCRTPHGTLPGRDSAHQRRLSSHKESALCHCVARAQALRLATQAARPAELATPGDLPEPTPSPLRWPGDAPRL